MKKKTKIVPFAIVVLTAYALFWSCFPLINYFLVNSYIEQWNTNATHPYRIEHKGITINRMLLGSPFDSTIAISQMKLVFKDSDVIITSADDVELSSWIYERTLYNITTPTINF